MLVAGWQHNQFRGVGVGGHDVVFLTLAGDGGIVIVGEGVSVKERRMVAKEKT